MYSVFTSGIEEEFQLVDRYSGQLRPRIQAILEKGHAFFGELSKPELLQSTVEINSAVLPEIPTTRQEMRDMRATLAALVEVEGLALVSAGIIPQPYGRTNSVHSMSAIANWNKNFRMSPAPS